MPRHRLVRHAAYLALVLQLLLGFGLSRALVLCRGADGHVEVESTFTDVCGSLPGTPDPSVAPTEHARCGNCVDTPLLTATVRPDDAGKAVGLPLAIVGLVPHAPTDLRPRASCSAHRVADAVAPATALCRTVVLLV